MELPVLYRLNEVQQVAKLNWSLLSIVEDDDVAMKTASDVLGEVLNHYTPKGESDVSEAIQSKLEAMQEFISCLVPSNRSHFHA